LPIVLLRIDERLIHGQVVIGWAYQLRPDRYVIVDDDLAASRWEQDLYRLGAAGVEVSFFSAADAITHLDEWRAAYDRTILLTRDIATMRRLAESGSLRGESVVVGGVHHAPGRAEALTYVHLTEKELRDLEAIEAAGVEVVARDLPDAPRAELELLRRRWNSYK
jgi:PTS system mannose-specific IIB component/fructoselysine and glucoselysine-specific PTS system IIB component